MAQCITITGKGILRLIHGPAAVYPAFDPSLDESKRPAPCKVTAIWDTGAMGSVVTQSVVDRCGLKQIGIKKVAGVHSEK